MSDGIRSGFQSGIRCALCILLCLATITGITACGGREAKESPVRTKIEVLVESASVYLMTVVERAETDCCLGSQLSAYRLEKHGMEAIDYEMYPVFSGDRIVAVVTVTENEKGEYLGGCGVDFAGGLNDAYAERPDDPLAIVYAADGTYLLRAGEKPVLLLSATMPTHAPISAVEQYTDGLTYHAIERETEFELEVWMKTE